MSRGGVRNGLDEGRDPAGELRRQYSRDYLRPGHGRVSEGGARRGIVGRLARGIGVAAIALVLLLLVVRAAKHDRGGGVPAPPVTTGDAYSVVGGEPETYVESVPEEITWADKESVEPVPVKPPEIRAS